MILLHGRGDTADGILGLAERLDAGGFAYLAPQAAGNTWYPQRFSAPLEANEPWLTSALEAVSATVEVANRVGLPPDRLLVLGFSQGACLALEYAARHAQTYGGVVGLTGGLIGPDNAVRDYAGRLDSTQVFLGCGDPDPHIPLARVDETEAVLSSMGATVTKRIYPGLGHTVNDDELAFVRRMMGGLLLNTTT